ncbi:sigma-70 family RNA polymerase sigma factor [Chitinophaga pendula]|uniref:RNA polymerase sigma factor n=1 Tax=Chitinophaga TaxID=79328 RepID=UPI000BAEE343|nr:MULTISPECIES: sigma-70 family RNA polymerase sigma factor [Chitinophaga]ASZ11060.1 hypothetical protein CK934_08850 [Chitinophaga sp. MD30]UCJ05942.1 sigma-70 family RNA polymerase sigma factor [Chitinophaga pendula]
MDTSVTDWEEFLNGDMQAFGRIYARFAPLLYNYGRKQTASPALVEDCIQDIFEYILAHHRQLSPVNNVKAYLLTAYRRALLQKLTTERKTTNIDTSTSPLSNFELVISPESQLIQSQSHLERRRKVVHELNILPARMKEVLYLRFYENLPFEDIAAIMHIDQRSVYKMVYKAFGKLRQKLVDFPLWLLSSAIISLSWSW